MRNTNTPSKCKCGRELVMTSQKIVGMQETPNILYKPMIIYERTYSCPFRRGLMWFTHNQWSTTEIDSDCEKLIGI